MQTIGNGDFYVNEIFRSIQGEGNFSGVNALFVRFQCCNLRCVWCDTKYTWSIRSDAYKGYSAEELVEKIAFAPSKHIVFTGGEPTLYRLDRLAVDESKKYHVESNGSIDPQQPLDIRLPDGTHVWRDAMDESVVRRFNWVISPKLAHSGVKTDECVWRFWAEKAYAVFKIVVRTAEDLDEVDGWSERGGIEKDRIYLALEGNTREAQHKPGLVEKIMERGYHFSPRLHVLLWDDQRGR